MIPRLAVDLHVLQVEGYADRGIGRYAAAHASALHATGRVAACLLAPTLPPPFGLPPALAGEGLVRWDSIGETRRLGAVALHITAPFVNAQPADPGELVITRHWAETGLPRVSTVYDLIPLRSPAHYLPTTAHEARYRARAQWVAQSDLLLAISDHVKSEVLELLDVEPNRVVTIGCGVSSYFSPRDDTDNELFRFHFPHLESRPFLLTVGGSDPRKNTERLIGAIGQLTGGGWDLHLMVAGDLTDAWRARLEATARASGVGSRLTFTGRVSDELLRACYRRAELTIMPSLAEGFGLPVLEAAASGSPVLASSTTALAEAAGTPVATFDPTSAEAIGAAIAAALDDESLRAEIATAQRELAAKSTWADVADRTVAGLDAMSARIDQRRWRPAPSPPRVAVVGPLPPLGGGLGVYDRRVIAALNGVVRVDAVTPMLRRPSLPPGVGHVPADAFGPTVNPAGYDAVVYALGNSDGHLATALLALRHPGWLWLHEVRLPALATGALSEADDDRYDQAMGWLAERAYPGRAPRHALRLGGRSVLELVEGGVGLTSLLAARARGVLVNSEVARRLLVLDLAPFAHQPPVHVLPPACPPARPSGRTSTEQAEPLVVALGVVSMAKRPDVLVDAVARVARVRPCRLAFIGPCPPILAEVISDRARARGVASLVEVSGSVDEAAWEAWCDRAAVAVQLREASSGETSAAVLEALARGLPVLTNLASAAEYPAVACTTDTVGERLLALLNDREAQDEASVSGLAFAREHPFERLAEAMVAATVSA